MQEYQTGLAHNPEPDADDQWRDDDLRQMCVEECESDPDALLDAIGEMDVKLAGYLLASLIYGPERDRANFADLTRRALQPHIEREALRRLSRAAQRYNDDMEAF